MPPGAPVPPLLPTLKSVNEGQSPTPQNFARDTETITVSSNPPSAPIVNPYPVYDPAITPYDQNPSWAVMGTSIKMEATSGNPDPLAGHIRNADLRLPDGRAVKVKDLVLD